MSETKHTPAPWFAEDPMDGWHVRADDPNRAGKRFHICDIGPSHRSRADEIQAMANARLIAEAPVLLKALIDLDTLLDFGSEPEAGEPMEWPEDPSLLIQRFREARAAIAKATA